MKLKRVFVALIGEAWSDYAMFEDRPPQFEEGLQLGDIYQRMFWHAIEDLDRLSVRSLPEAAVADAAAWEKAVADYRKAWTLWDTLAGDYSDEEANAVSDVAHPALYTLIDTPAPNATALVTKIEEIRRDGRDVTNDDLDSILADVRRFAQAEAQ